MPEKDPSPSRLALDTRLAQAGAATSSTTTTYDISPPIHFATTYEVGSIPVATFLLRTFSNEGSDSMLPR